MHCLSILLSFRVLDNDWDPEEFSIGESERFRNRLEIKEFYVTNSGGTHQNRFIARKEGDSPLGASGDAVGDDSCLADFASLRLEEQEKFSVRNACGELRNEY